MLEWWQVRDELTEAVRLSWRLPRPVRLGRTRASDGPWHLITRLDRAGSAVEAWRQEQDEVREQRARPLATVPLTAEEVDWMEARIDWLALIDDRDRKLVWLAVMQLASGAANIHWLTIRRALPAEVSRVGLYRRFVRALQRLAADLNARD